MDAKVKVFTERLEKGFHDVLCVLPDVDAQKNYLAGRPSPLATLIGASSLVQGTMNRGVYVPATLQCSLSILSRASGGRVRRVARTTGTDVEAVVPEDLRPAIVLSLAH